MAFFSAVATSLLLEVFHVRDGVCRAIPRYVVLIHKKNICVRGLGLPSLFLGFWSEIPVGVFEIGDLPLNLLQMWIGIFVNTFGSSKTCCVEISYRIGHIPN
jgi:hypothetical protein